MALDSQSRDERIAGWLVVLVVHAGLFWVLTLQPPARQLPTSESRLRLVFISPTAPKPTRPAPAVSRPTVQMLPTRPRPAAFQRAEPALPAADPTPVAVAEPGAEPDHLSAAGETWTKRTPRPDFTPDPLRSRRAQLPGGEGPERFRMRPPVSVASVLQGVAGAFGDPGPPCPRVQQRLAGLLSDSSERGRALLQEELRRERQFCQD